MTIQYRVLSAGYLESSQFPDLMARFEQPVERAYDDGKGIATIGIGVNLRNRHYLALVLQQLNVFAASDAAVVGSETEAQRNARYARIVNDFLGIIARHPLNRAAQQEAGTSASEAALRSALDQALAPYVPTGASSNFLVQPAQSEALVRSIVLGSAIGPFVDGGKEARLDARLRTDLNSAGQAYNINIPHDTHEYLALMSLFFNSEGKRLGPGRYDSEALVGNGLLTALSQGNRAEAWYEIRYNSNGDQTAGIAKRRFAEAQVFALYNDESNVSADEARDVYRMLQLHRNQILRYEALYGVMPNGASPGRNMIDHPDDGANRAYGFDGTPYEVDRLTESLDAAEASLIADINARNPGLNLSADNYLSTNIFVDPGRSSAAVAVDPRHRSVLDSPLDFQGNPVAANDILLGEDGDDDLNAGEGDDVLIGGNGDDRLRGGLGNDIYVINTGQGLLRLGDGFDRIVGNDNDGSIWVDGTRLTGDGARAFIHPLYSNRPAWRSVQNGRAFDFILIDGDLTTGGTLWILGEGMGTEGLLVVEEFRPGDLGLDLAAPAQIILTPDVPAVNPFADPNFLPGTQTAGLAEGHARTLTFATNLPALVEQRLRLDVPASIGGSLTVVLGTDILEFSGGSLEIVIPAGSSLLTLALVSQGDIDTDQTFNLTATLLNPDGTPSAATANLAVTFDATVEGTAVQTMVGDLRVVDSDPGEPGVQPEFDALGNRVTDGTPQPIQDYLQGTGNNDRIVGGSEGDILWGGAGDDELFADNVIDLQTAITAGAIGAGTEALTALRGVEGDNFLRGGNGNDTLVGGSGEEMLSGGAGSDLLIGGQGNDFLSGDGDFFAGEQDFDFDWSFIDTGSAFGIDGDVSGFLFPAAGDDVIHAGGGSDVVYAGGGTDQVYGDDGNDSLQGGGGVDTLFGGNGNDRLNGDIDFQNIYNAQQDAADFLDGGAGNDELRGGGGADALFGGADSDVLVGDEQDQYAGNDYLDGESGNDTLYGEAGADRLLGGDGDDNLYGDSTNNAPALQGNDQLDGGGGNDLLLGLGGADTLIGGDGNDQLFGESSDTPEEVHGDDHLSGGAGNDVLVGDGGADRLFGGADDDQLFGEATSTPEARQAGDYLDGEAGNDILVGGGGSDTLLGGEGNDTLDGDSLQTPDALEGDDHLDGGAGNDTLIGAGGSDTLLGGEGDDSLDGDSLQTPDALEGDDYLDGGAGNDTLIGAGGSDTLLGGEGDDALAGDSSDTPAAFHGDDTLDGGAGFDELFGFGGSDVLSGGEDDDTLSGGEGNDVLLGGAGEDLLLGGLGADILDGGEGRDIYVYSAGSGQDRIADSGGNTLQFDFSWTGLQLGLGSLTLSFAGRPGDVIHLDGFDADDPFANVVIDRFEFTDRVMTYDDVLALGFSFQGTPEADFLEGTALADRIQGLASDDTLVGKGGADELDGGEGVDLLVAGDGDDQLLGGAGDDTLLGDAGNDLVDGGAGADTLYGGAGNDTFMVGEAGDVVTEFAGEGTDTVQASVTHTLADNVENLTLTGAAAINGTGNALNNVLTGNTTDNRLDGGSGVDTMAGGAGNDTYVVDNTGDTITETAGNGIDTVESSVTYALGAEVENLTLTGAATINATGNALANVITGNIADNVLNGLGGDDTLLGNAGNDTLDGGIGNDSLAGAAGNDTYRVDSAADVIVENTDEGVDVVDATVTYTLAANVENLNLLGSTTINGTGNDLANVINGNVAGNVLSGLGGNDTLNGSAGNDTLNGGTGTDTMAGGSGNDTYIVDDAADTVDETSANDTGDRVEASVSYALSSSARIETFVLTGAAAINATGNGFTTTYLGNDAANVITDTAGGNDNLQGNGGNDTLVAGSGFNTLNGGTGDDAMSGGAGNDTYIVDSAGDLVIENVGEGTDTVQASATYTLAANVENLTLTGTAAINGTGNDLNNFINGNAAGNILSGMGGNDSLQGNNGDDTLDGGTGNDTLRGAAGNDTLLGGEGNDFFFDSSGNNAMAGGTGDDTYDVSDSTANAIVENAGEGIDRVVSLVSHTLADNVENLTLEDSTESLEEDPNGIGNALDNVLTGNNFRNELDGLDGDDTLDGRSGNDALFGRAGDDTLFGGIDAGGTGFDPRNEAPFTRPIENDDLLDGGAGDDDLDGGSGNDTLLGGDGVDNLFGGADGPLNPSNNDTLDGGTGLDTMAGGTGNDTYYVDGIYTDLPGEPTLDECGLPITGPTRRVWTADTITENTNQGYDVVYSSASITLPENFEEVILQGTDNLDVTAGAGAQILLGNSGNNRLDGGAGADSLTGGAGNDTYVVDQSGDVVTEAAANGIDTVESSLDYTLGANLERLVLLSGATQGFGNALDNTLIGNAANNRLEGATGNDALNGGAGNDELYGGEGDDTYYFGAGSGEDVVFDLQGVNRVRVLGTLTANDVTLTESGDNLILTINGTNDRLTLTGWATVEALHSGNATFCVCGCAVQLQGCSGGETIVGTSANEVLSGTPCADDITGGGGSDQLLGNGGNDRLRVHYWDDCWSGSATSAAGLGLDGKIRTFDVFNGGDGTDTLIGTQDGDAILLEDEVSQRPAGTSGARIIGVEIINAGDGHDVVDLSSDLYTYGNVTIDGGADDDTLWANSGNDVLIGGTGSDWLIGDAGNDFQLGGAGDDWLWDEEGLGNDVMQGEAGDDQFLDNAGQNLFDGGAGADQITDGAGSSLLIGGDGDDFINTGAGNDIVLYNIGDGVDTVRSWEGEGADNVLSLGGVLDYSQLYFSRSGDDLILETDTNGRVVLEGWYYYPGYPSVDRLQVITELMSGYNQSGSNALLDDKIETFDFESLVAAFDAAQAANPSLTRWALTNALTQFHLSGSDTEALGGDLAYQYGLNGSLTGIGLTPTQEVIGASTFGTGAQTLRPRASLEVGSLRLV